MPFDLIAFGEATPGTGTPFVAAGANESLYASNGDNVTLTKKVNSLLGIYAWAVATGGYVAIRQSSKKIDDRIIKVAGPAAAIHEPMQGFTDLFARPTPLYPEILNTLINNAGDEDALIGLFVGSGPITQAMKDAAKPTHIMRGISDTTATAFTWTDATITWDENLPHGNYIPVGMRVAVYKASAAQPALARLLVPQNTNWRPGVICTEAQADKLEVQEGGYMPFADWPVMPTLKFPYDQPPNIQVFGSEASTDWLVELQVQKA